MGKARYCWHTAPQVSQINAMKIFQNVFLRTSAMKSGLLLSYDLITTVSVSEAPGV